MKKIISFTVDQENLDMVDAKAKKLHQSRSSIINGILRDVLEGEKILDEAQDLKFYLQEVEDLKVKIEAKIKSSEDKKD